MKLKVAQFGLGPIGIECIKLAAEKSWLSLVGGVDIDPDKVGRSLESLTGVAGLGQAQVFDTFEALLAEERPDVVLHTAGSRAAVSLAQMEPMIRAGISVVSSCEELLYPGLRAPAEAAAADESCRRHNARILGTGVNPGFVLDVLPVCLTGVCRSVKGIYAERVVNASTRRMPLQKKIGSGMDPDEFRGLFKAGKAGHAGFQESLALIAHAMGWEAEDITETCEPMMADHDIRTDYFEVRKGLTCGLHQVVEAGSIKLDLKMYLDAEDPRDEAWIEGDPPVHARIEGGIAGDRATVASVINAIPRLLKAPAGVRLMTDIAVPCCA